MKSIWLKNLGGKERKDREQEVLQFRRAFSELTEVLTHSYQKKEACRDYENPNWASQQIAVNEYNQVLKQILDLIDLDKE